MESAAMATCPNLPDLSAAYDVAKRDARRLCRSLGLPRHEQEDIQQDLLADFLTRLPAYDPAKAELAAFATVCMRHAGTRIARRVRAERRTRHPLSLDDVLPGTEGVTLGSTLSTGDSYAAWCGQPMNDIAALERRLDLARAGEDIDPIDHPLCAALTEHTPHELGELGAMPRMSIYRRIREMRLRLLAAGLGSVA
jgi:RNA polymerase sigma-70 factor (ECF subfamily)